MKKINFFFLAIIFCFPVFVQAAHGEAVGADNIFYEIGLEKPQDWSEMSRDERFDYLGDLGIYPGPSGKYRAQAGDLSDFFAKLGKEAPKNWDEMSFDDKKAFVSSVLSQLSEVTTTNDQGEIEKDSFWSVWLPYHSLFAKISWVLLSIILLMRPLFMSLGLQKACRFLHFRKQLGVLASLFAFLHILVFLYGVGRGLEFLLKAGAWRFDNLFGWGTIGVAILIPLFLTSNTFSQRMFKRNWKRIQRLSYLLYIAVGIHILFARKGFDVLTLPVVIWLFFFLLAWFKGHFSKKDLEKCD